MAPPSDSGNPDQKKYRPSEVDVKYVGSFFVELVTGWRILVHKRVLYHVRLDEVPEFISEHYRTESGMVVFHEAGHGITRYVVEEVDPSTGDIRYRACERVCRAQRIRERIQEDTTE